LEAPGVGVPVVNEPVPFGILAHEILAPSAAGGAVLEYEPFGLVSTIVSPSLLIFQLVCRLFAGFVRFLSEQKTIRYCPGASVTFGRTHLYGADGSSVS